MTRICGFVKNVPNPCRRRRLSKMIPKEGTCNCEACKAYWEAVREAREAWEAWHTRQVPMEAMEAHEEDE